MNDSDERYIKLLDQDEYLLDPRDGNRVSVLEADFDMCLNYVSMYMADPTMTRTIYFRAVEEPFLGGPNDILNAAVEGANVLSERSQDYPSARAYGCHWLVSKPLMRVLLQRVAGEIPHGTVE